MEVLRKKSVLDIRKESKLVLHLCSFLEGQKSPKPVVKQRKGALFCLKLFQKHDYVISARIVRRFNPRQSGNGTPEATDRKFVHNIPSESRIIAPAPRSTHDPRTLIRQELVLYLLSNKESDLVGISMYLQRRFVTKIN